jgi:hypothetical protein
MLLALQISGVPHLSAMIPSQEATPLLRTHLPRQPTPMRHCKAYFIVGSRAVQQNSQIQLSSSILSRILQLDLHRHTGVRNTCGRSAASRSPAHLHSLATYATSTRLLRFFPSLLPLHALSLPSTLERMSSSQRLPRSSPWAHHQVTLTSITRRVACTARRWFQDSGVASFKVQTPLSIQSCNVLFKTRRPRPRPAPYFLPRTNLPTHPVLIFLPPPLPSFKRLCKKIRLWSFLSIPSSLWTRTDLLICLSTQKPMGTMTYQTLMSREGGVRAPAQLRHRPITPAPSNMTKDTPNLGVMTL